MEKSTLRKSILHKLNNLDVNVHNEHSNHIHKKVLVEEKIQNAQVIGITLSSFPEVDTWQLIKKLWSMGKQVAVPKCEPATRGMTFYEINSFDQLEVVYMKLKEPIPSLTKRLESTQIDVLIVPGVVFNKQGYRIGFGGGYYDRFLSSYNGATFALAFDSQIVNEIPIERFDLPVQCIITETKRIKSSKVE
jgi:5-formyltetrahydrofolate cyclo-ligase